MSARNGRQKMYSPELDPKRCYPAEPDRRAASIIGGVDDFDDGMTKCSCPGKKIANSNKVGKERNSRLTNSFLLLFVAGLSLIVTLLTRCWIADELSYVFKDKVTGRITRVEQKEEVSKSRRKGRVRYRRYTKEIEHYSYNVAGRNYKGASTARWSKHKEGEDPRVSIYYNPDKPSESRLFSVWWVFTKVGVGCVLMWMFFWACVSTARDFTLAHADPVVRDKVPGWMCLVSIVMVIVALAV